MSESERATVPAPATLLDPRVRRLVVVSFWAVALFGVPFWWKTTEIERLPLPDHEIQEWNKAQPCIVRPAIDIRLEHVDGGLKTELDHFAERLERDQCVQLSYDGSQPHYTLSYSPSLAQTVINSHSIQTATPVQALETLFNVASSPEKQRMEEARVVKYASKYKIVFSLLNQDSTKPGAILDWDIERLLRRHIQPLLTSLKDLHQFEIETQLRYFAPLSVEAFASPESGKVIKEDDLRAFVNHAEWNLGAPLTLDPTLHFVLYVPQADEQPLNIQREDGTLDSTNAFITPQWGGVVIHNSEVSSDKSLDTSFHFFSQQLRKLLGVPSRGGSGGSGSGSGRLEEWQIESMILKRLKQVLSESVDTLEAISSLVEKQPNMRVGKEVQQGVQKSLAQLSLAKETSSIAKALSHAAQAQELASKAYYNPTMLALLYFPDEHKYAVYTPLFGPVAVPMLVALLKEIKEWREGRRRARAKTD